MNGERIDDYFLSREEKVLQVILNSNTVNNNGEKCVTICMPIANEACQSLFGFGWKEFQEIRSRIWREGISGVLLPKSLALRKMEHHYFCPICGSTDLKCFVSCECKRCSYYRMTDPQKIPGENWHDDARLWIKTSAGTGRERKRVTRMDHHFVVR